MNNIVGIDPGTYESAAVIYDSEQHKVKFVWYGKNSELVKSVRIGLGGDTQFIVGYERMQHYSVREGVGNSTFLTCAWYGRFIESFFHLGGNDLPIYSVTSPDVKLALLGLPNVCGAKLLVKRAIWELFPLVGGGSTPAVGTKTQPGPLYIMKNFPAHCYDALAVSIVVNLWLQGRFVGDIYKEKPSEI